MLAATNNLRSPAREDYLKALFHLGAEGRAVPTADLAGMLGVSKPSVSAMLKRLAEEGLADHSPRRGARLTPDGERLAVRVVRRHRLLETFLVEVLGLDWSEVHEEAEVLEHHLSDRLVEAMDRVLGNPEFDPHGHPIPDDAGEVPSRELTPLGDLQVGQAGTVREVSGREAERLQRWKHLGLVPGARLVMRARQDMEDVLHIGVGERLLVTGSEGVEGVFVERTR